MPAMSSRLSLQCAFRAHLFDDEILRRRPRERVELRAVARVLFVDDAGRHDLRLRADAQVGLDPIGLLTVRPYFSSNHFVYRHVENPLLSMANCFSTARSGKLLWRIRFTRIGVSSA